MSDSNFMEVAKGPIECPFRATDVQFWSTGYLVTEDSTRYTDI